MTPEAQRIAIAEACGTHSVVWGNDCASLTDKNGCKADYWWSPFEGCPRGFAANDGFVYPPDYHTDLNAMHEAEKVLITSHRWPVFADHVKAIVIRDDGRSVIHATAAQRAEAFLRTIEKWEDSQ